MKKIVLFTVVPGLVAAAACFSPWVTDGFAKTRAEAAFEARWRDVQDGCGFACEGCGAIMTEKAPFGRKVTIEYACGTLPFDAPGFHRRDIRFVTFLGTVH